MEHGANPVQRLLIVHEGLPEICGGLDEGASIEELSEHILYYYDANLHFLNGADESSHNTHEAVHFAGLSSALRSLPSAMGDSNDCTEEMQLCNATLIFVSLEEAFSRKVMAVVQVARALGSATASPLAIRSAVKRCHDLFCILRCGGIHHRMSCNNYFQSTGNHKEQDSTSFMGIVDNCTDDPPPELSLAADVDQQGVRSQPSMVPEMKEFEDGEDYFLYPGMKQLYTRRKEARKLRETLNKTSELLTVKRHSLQQELMELEIGIQQMLEDLPIPKLRKHLVEHYNEFVGTSAFSGVAFRCLIESVPRPIPDHVDGVSDQHLSPIPNIFSSIHLGRSMQALLDAAAKHYSQESPHLIGISSFFKGQLLYTHTMSSIQEFEGSTDQFGPRLSLSKKTATLLMGYMASFRQKIENAVQSSTRNLLHDQQAAFLNVRLSRMYIRPTKDEASVLEIDTDQQAKNLGRFLTSPPLSMLYVSDDVQEVHAGLFGNVWTPVVHIPLDDQSDRNFVQVNVVLYDDGDYSFLLYIDPGRLKLSLNRLGGTSDVPKAPDMEPGLGLSHPNANLSSLAVLLEHFANEISACVKEISADSGHTGSVLSFSEIEGQHVVYVDRSMEKLVLFTSCCALSDGTKGGTSVRKRLGTKNAHEDDTFLRSNIDIGTPEVDCRHNLASQLSEDVVLAFDDMMSSVQEARGINDEFNAFNEFSHGNGLEMCTYIAQGWMWACASGDRELYMFFDSKRYSTITEVETSARCIRDILFNENANCG